MIAKKLHREINYVIHRRNTIYIPSSFSAIPVSFLNLKKGAGKTSHRRFTPIFLYPFFEDTTPGPSSACWVVFPYTAYYYCFNSKCYSKIEPASSHVLFYVQNLFFLKLVLSDLGKLTCRKCKHLYLTTASLNTKRFRSAKITVN